MDSEAPTHFAAPSGSLIAIDYEAPEGPKLSIRVQELFGLDRHPTVAGGRVPLVVELLSPAHRPVQVTREASGLSDVATAGAGERSRRVVRPAFWSNRLPSHGLDAAGKIFAGREPEFRPL